MLCGGKTGASPGGLAGAGEAFEAFAGLDTGQGLPGVHNVAAGENIDAAREERGRVGCGRADEDHGGVFAAAVEDFGQGAV